MARYRHGGRPSDFTIGDPTLTGGTVTIAANAPGTFWSAASGGTQYSDLQTLAGAPTTSISSDTKGNVVPFLGPDEVRGGWADFGGGRFWLDPVGPTPPATAVAVGGIQLAGDLGGTAAAPTVPGLTGKVAKGSLVYNVKDYGLKGDGTVEDMTAINAAINAATTGVEVFFPPTSNYYNLRTPLPEKSNVTYRGAGPASQIIVTAGSLMSLTTMVGKVRFSKLSLRADAGHLFDLGTTGYLYQSTFMDCTLNAAVAGAALIKGTGAIGYQEVVMQRCDLIRPSSATVPAFDLSCSIGALNQNSWQDCRASSGNGGTTYFWRMQETSASAVYDNTWRNITGEQNPAGLLWLSSAMGVTLESVIDYDVSASYTSSLVKIDKTAAGVYPSRIYASNVGNRGGSLPAGVYHIEATAALASPLVLDRIGDSFNTAKVSTVAGYGASWRDAWGASGVVGLQTGSYALNETADGTIVFNAVSATASLPDPTTVPTGRRFTVKNVNATALIVVSAGTSKTIDGAASQSLAQWAKATYVSDGTQWLTV